MFGLFRKKTTSAVASPAEQQFIRQISQSSPTGIAALLREREFVAIEDPDVSQAAGTVPLMLEVDGFPALAVFTSEQLVPAFIRQMGYKQFKGEVPAFVLEGHGMLAGLPAGAGVILNPSSDAMWVIPPDMVAKIRACVGV